MNVLKGVLYFFAGLFLLVPLVWFNFMGFGLFGVIIAAVGVALAYVVFKQAKNFNVQASDSQKVQLEDTFKSLAAKNDNVVPITALMNATGQNRDQVQARMRELMGKGICDLDFNANGEMQYKLTPFDEARAQLAEVNKR